MENSVLNFFLGNKFVKYILIGIFCTLIANVVILDVLFFNSEKKITEKIELITQENSEVCTENCSAKLSQITTSQKTLDNSSQAAEQSIISPSSTPSLTPTSTPAPTETPTEKSSLREYFIPLGLGSGSYGDWTVVPGIGAKIDPANYGEIEKIYFEITLRIPTGNQTVYARLYNANTFQAVAGSEQTLSGGTTTLLTSQPIALSSGNNLYQVQLKTQLQYATYIDQARIRIVSR